MPSIFNADQGSQFTKKEFTEMQSSMDSRGRVLDNLFVERLVCGAREVYGSRTVSDSTTTNAAQCTGEPNTRTMSQKNLTKGKSLLRSPPEQAGIDELSVDPSSVARSGSVTGQLVIHRVLTQPKAPAKIESGRVLEAPSVLLYCDILFFTATCRNRG